MQGIFEKVFHIFFISSEKSKKSIKKLLPQKRAIFDILSQIPQFQGLVLSQKRPQRLQNDKMPEKWFFAGCCDNEKKAVTLSQSKKPRNEINTFIIYNF